MRLDPQAQLAVAAAIGMGVFLFVGGAWRRYEAGKLTAEELLRSAVVVVGILVAVTLVFSTRFGAILVAPAAILGLGLWLRNNATTLRDQRFSARLAGNLAILSGAGWLLIGVVRLATGA